jgi:hypothetical protein
MQAEHNDLFHRTRDRATALVHHYCEVYDGVLALLPSEKRKEFVEEFGPHRAQVLKAKQALLRNLENPPATVINAGTTNGGKSTVGNLLAGMEILPSENKEVTAGVTIVEEARARQHPLIEVEIWPHGRGADCQAEPLNTQGKSVIDIRDALKNHMDAYNRQRDAYFTTDGNGGQLSPPPEFIIRMPLKMGEHLGLTGRIRRYHCREIDLPGIKELGDTNATLLQECERGVTLVVIDGHRVLDLTVDETLNEIIALVKRLDGHPSRLIFVLNKMDAFCTDFNYKCSAKDFINGVKDKIATKLTEHFGEQFASARDLVVIPICGMAALLAQNLPATPDDYWNDEALQTRVNAVCAIVPPREFHAAQAHPALLANVLMKYSNAPQLFEAIREKLETHLPTVVIKPMVADFLKDGVHDAVVALLQQVSAFAAGAADAVEEAGKEFKKKIRALMSARRKLRAELEGAFDPICSHSADLPPQKLIHAFMQCEANLQGLCSPPGRYHQIDPKAIRPLFLWRLSVEKDIKDLIDVVSQWLKGNQEESCPSLSLLSAAQKDALERASRVVNAAVDNIEGIGGWWRTGAGIGHIEARDHSSQEALACFNRALDTFTETLAHALNNVAQATLSTETVKVRHALIALFQEHNALLAREAHQIAPGIGIDLPDPAIAEFRGDFRPIFRFPGALAISRERYEPQLSIPPFHGNPSSWWGKRRNALHEKLRAAERQMYEAAYRWRYGTLAIDKAELPSVEQLNNDWLRQASSQHMALQMQFFAWLLPTLEGFLRRVAQGQQTTITAYCQRLSKVEKELIEDLTKHAEQWQKVQLKSDGLTNDVTMLTLGIEANSADEGMTTSDERLNQ